MALVEAAVEFDAQHYRNLAQHCRERATLRRLPCDRDIMLGAAEEFERLAINAERIGNSNGSGPAKFGDG